MSNGLKKYAPFDNWWDDRHQARGAYSAKEKPSPKEEKRNDIYAAMANLESMMQELEYELDHLRDMIDSEYD